MLEHMYTNIFILILFELSNLPKSLKLASLPHLTPLPTSHRTDMVRAAALHSAAPLSAVECGPRKALRAVALRTTTRRLPLPASTAPFRPVPVPTPVGMVAFTSAAPL